MMNADDYATNDVDIKIHFVRTANFMPRCAFCGAANPHWVCEALKPPIAACGVCLGEGGGKRRTRLAHQVRTKRELNRNLGNTSNIIPLWP
jgi:hypothetical protein